MEASTQKSIEQMRNFIIQEAREKAQEIQTKTEEDFFVEKNNILEAEKSNIRKEYERKESQISVRRRTELSKKSSSVLLEIQKQRNELLEGLLEKAKNETVERMKDKAYREKVYTNLIAQGLVALMEENVAVICRKEDVDTVKAVCAAAVEKAKKVTGTSIDMHASPSEKEFLPPAPSPSYEGPTCIGGCVLACHNGKIRLDNTFETRLQQSFQHMLPRMKEILFPEKLQNIF